MIDLNQVFDIYDDRGYLLLEKTAGSIPGDLRQLELLSQQQRDRLPDNVFAGILVKEGEVKRCWPCHDRGHTAISCLYFLKTAEEFPRQVKQKIAENLVRACAYYGLCPPIKLQKQAAKPLLQTDGSEIIATKPKQKKLSEINGTPMAPLTATSLDTEKMASIIEDPYVELTGQELEKKAEFYDDEWYALVSEKNGRQFPLVTYQQIKEASDYFVQNFKQLHPRTRREFCTKLAARAMAVDFPLQPYVLKYGAEGYAPSAEMRIALDMRKNLIVPELTGHLDELLQKQATIDPEIFAEVLARVDIEGGIDRHWDSLIPDPWATTFGPEKRAEWKWIYGNTVLDEADLRVLAEANRKLVETAFGSEFADELEKNPTEIFDSMPLDKKQILAQLAQSERRN